MSLIRGGHSYNVISVSDEPIHSHRENPDAIIAFDERTLENHEQDLAEDGFIIGNASLKTEGDFIPLEVDEVVKELDIPKIMTNTVYLGALFKSIGMELDPLLTILKEEFPDAYESNRKAAEKGYELVEEHKKLGIKKAESKYFVTGSQAIGLGAIKSGLDVYVAYPMTPSTPVFHFLASKQEEYDFLVTQAENEIAVANAALGASYSGAMSMLGTSGGGFALMSAMMSFQGMSEIPLVAYLAQRPGPSVGMATRQAQGDLKFALNPAHGEFPKIVMAPGDAMEAYQKTPELFYFSQKYRMLAILLGDKHVAESHFTYDELLEPVVQPELNIEENPPEDLDAYELTETGVSRRAVPGQGPMVKANADEHLERGYTTEESGIATKMAEKRQKKMTSLQKELDKFETTKTYGEGKTLVIGWGSTKGAILDTLKELSDVRYLQILYLSPFPAEKVKKEIENAGKTVLVENNVTGLLGDVIREKTGIQLDRRILKYDGHPLTKEWLLPRLKEVVE